MRETLQVEAREPQYIVNTGVTFAQVPGWGGHMTQDLKMDIIYPERTTKDFPCIVWICGGAWLQMSTSAHLAYLCDLARKGFVVASVQYRTSNEVVFPGQLEDIKAAIRYLRAHAERYHIESGKFGVMGESAGGHLAAMTALTGQLKEFDKGQHLNYSSEVQAACPWYLPADISKMPRQEDMKMQAAPESLLIGKNAAYYMEEAMKACPVSYVTPQAPPFLLIHGTCDRTVPFSQSEAMYEALEGQGTEVDMIAIEGADHADIHFFQKEVWDRIETFFKDKLSGEVK